MARVQITGKGTLRFTGTGKAILEVSQNIAPRRKNRDTGQWEQQGADLWVRGALWEQEAETVADLAGDHRVILEGELSAREYDGKAGRQTSVELLWPRFVGVRPDTRNSPQAAYQTSTQPNPHDPPQTDTWGQPRNDTAPF